MRMPMRTMRMSRKLLVLSALFVPSVAYAQTPPPPPPAEAPAPPPAAAEPAPEPAKPAHSWFWRPALEYTVGSGDMKWVTQIYGFAELDVINDSTRAYNESEGPAAIPRNDAFGGKNGRTQFSAR